MRVSQRDSGSGASRGTSIRDRAQRSGSATDLPATFSKSLTAGDVDSLATASFKDPNPVIRRLAFAKLLESVTAENAPQIREQLANLGAGGQELRDFNYAWGALSGKEAFDIAAQGNKRDLESLITGWAAVDPDGAMAMLNSLPEDLAKERGRLESGIVSGLADRDHEAATDYVQSLAAAGNENAARLMTIVAGEMMRENGPESASIWVEGLIDGPAKGRAMGRIAGKFVRDNPEAASRWIEQFAGEEYATAAVREVGSEWAERDPDSAVAWLDQLPDSKGQMSGLYSAFDDWEDRDPVAAGNYLLSMPSSAKRDSAIRGFALGISRQEPETAVAWANVIQDPKLREQSLIKTGQYYLRSNPEAAKAWLTNSGLPAKLKSKIQNTRRR